MRDILIGAITIAAGICLAVAVIASAWALMRPAKQVTVSLGEYSCTTDGKAVRCERK